MKLEIMIFIWNNNFVLYTFFSSNNSPFSAITALQTFGILAVNLLKESEEKSPHASWSTSHKLDWLDGHF